MLALVSVAIKCTVYQQKAALKANGGGGFALSKARFSSSPEQSLRRHGWCQTTAVLTFVSHIMVLTTCFVLHSLYMSLQMGPLPECGRRPAVLVWRNGRGVPGSEHIMKLECSISTLNMKQL